MRLTSQPETELQYWLVIEELGGFRHSMNHSLAHGRIEGDTTGVALEIVDAAKLQKQLVGEVCEKFGVFDPHTVPNYDPAKPPPTPEGKENYWDWYERMQTEYYKLAYEEIICSACPFSHGFEEMRDLRIIPCSVVEGQLYHLIPQSKCGMVSLGERWTEEVLFGKILEASGAEGLRRFILKEKELREKEQSSPEKTVPALA